MTTRISYNLRINFIKFEPKKRKKKDSCHRCINKNFAKYDQKSKNY